jgi:hypothetical protein
MRATLLPHVELTKGYLTALIAVLGTTISGDGTPTHPR